MNAEKRICAVCGKEYPEKYNPWPVFPQCSLCDPNPEGKPPTLEKVFKYYLQVAHGIKVSEEVALEILEAAKLHLKGE